ncbi:hypothetical protein [Butyrivibrio fibrisolvens]|uniref:hypothetical protein n=1 Tax=Butyrivibrio fibrisolvens TaxID=831 RepID=UPI0020BDBB26|nr:hypothetical protein [Butyrivibrio fibrisolvens]
MDEVFLSVHNMWYFPVLSISIMLYEMLQKIPARMGGIFEFSTAMIALFLLFKNPSIGKMLVYVLIFLAGTRWTINKRKAILNIVIDALILFFVVFYGHFVGMKSEGSSGIELIIRMVITFLGAGLIPSIMYLLLVNQSVSIQLHKRVCHENEKDFSNLSGNIYIDKCLKYISRNSQIFYFSQFLVIAIVESLRSVGLFGFLIGHALLYTVMCFGIAFLSSLFMDKCKIANRVLINPLK